MMSERVADRYSLLGAPKLSDAPRVMPYPAGWKLTVVGTCVRLPSEGHSAAMTKRHVRLAVLDFGTERAKAQPHNLSPPVRLERVSYFFQLADVGGV